MELAVVDPDEKKFLLVTQGPPKIPPKKPKSKKRKTLNCCLTSMKYTYKSCRCVIVHRCELLFLIFLIGVGTFVAYYWDEIQYIRGVIRKLKQD